MDSSIGRVRQEYGPTGMIYRSGECVRRVIEINGCSESQGEDL